MQCLQLPSDENQCANLGKPEKEKLAGQKSPDLIGLANSDDKDPVCLPQSLPQSMVCPRAWPSALLIRQVKGWGCFKAIGLPSCD